MGDIQIFGIAVPIALIIWYLVVRSLMGYLRHERDQKRQERQQTQEWYAKMDEDYPFLQDLTRIARRKEDR
jgi:hypothetical protein